MYLGFKRIKMVRGKFFPKSVHFFLWREESSLSVMLNLAPESSSGSLFQHLIKSTLLRP